MTASVLVEPAYLAHPPYARTLGPLVVDLATLAGFTPDAEQAAALDVIFGFREDGKACAFEFALICSRQNMKSALFEMCVLGWLFVDPQQVIVWSAHEMKTTKEAFIHLSSLIKSTPELRARLAPGPSEGIYRGNGDESIELASGQRVLFKARTHGGGRGLTGDRMILDEALYLQDVHMGALLPTLAAVPDPQVLYGSSAGRPESSILRAIRDRGRAGDDPSLAYIEYSSTPDGCLTEDCQHELTADGCALDSQDKRRQSNPAMGRRISVETLDQLRRAMPPREFAREFLGWWDDPLDEDMSGDIDLVKWAALANPAAPQPSGPAALAIDVPPDRSKTSLAVVWRGESGRLTGMVTALRGTATAVKTVQALQAAHNPLDISLHAGGPAGSLVADLAAAGVDVTSVTTMAMAQASGALVDLVNNEEVEHLDQPELNAAVAAARLRNTGDARLWDRRDLTDISPVVALTLALAGFVAHEPEEYDLLESIF